MAYGRNACIRNFRLLYCALGMGNNQAVKVRSGKREPKARGCSSPYFQWRDEFVEKSPVKGLKYLGNVENVRLTNQEEYGIVKVNQ